jgi:uracil-DNA glycosylase
MPPPIPAVQKRILISCHRCCAAAPCSGRPKRVNPGERKPKRLGLGVSSRCSLGDSKCAWAGIGRACRVCRDEPRYGSALPHEPRPVLQVSRSARICIASQAPGAKVHASGRPYTDTSGVRLKSWMGLDDATFYDSRKIAIIGMGFCFPGNDEQGGDLPPRKECAELWRKQLFDQLPNLRLLILIGQYAQRWHLGSNYTAEGVTGTVRRWRDVYESGEGPKRLPLPHPSWRNSGWLKRNPWFEQELVPVLRTAVAELV